MSELRDSLSLLEARFQIPVTTNMILIGVVGIVVALVLSRFPRPIRWLSRLTFLATVVAVIVVGIDDSRGGDLFDRATSRACMDWDGYVDAFDRQRSQYAPVLDRVRAGDLSPEDAAAALSDVERLTTALTELDPPDAATSLQRGWQSVLKETERQLRSYASGGDVDPIALNRLLDQAEQLSRTASDRCA